ncbi:unnamed protein product [Rotaria magnacalcarata]|uniref:CBM21 domain-containing protein n=1 Tax=Rotaria magnacalcarata TaxID=392030 RepID=A0A816N1R0_9BILA|nr:unnamed protein product [Rotaria magnacalcarata]CAF2028962.1 unnamed protein product [Rotaria magnacalcarata]
MSRKPILTNGNNHIDTPYISSSHKVMQYLRSSLRWPVNVTTTNTINFNSANNQKNIFSSTNNPVNGIDASMNNQFVHRVRSCSDNCSSISEIDPLSRFPFSLSPSLSESSGYRSVHSSNGSSSGVSSTISDVGQEENIFKSLEDLEFNLGFDQSSSSDGIEVADFDDLDESQAISNSNSDTVTLLDFGESNLDARINELKELLRKSNSSTSINSNGEINNDDTIIDSQTKKQQQKNSASFLHDSTYTLCSPDRFAAYAEDDNDNCSDVTSKIISKRSNSLGIPVLNNKSVLLDNPPKKAVRFADMLGLDLESIRYMTPPDQSANLLKQECIRIKLEQLRQAKNQLNSLTTSLNDTKKSTKQYYLVSKHFTSPTNIIPLIYDRQVMLECLYTKDSAAYGTVRVHNISFEKRVFTRLTDNEWQTSQDIYGWHSMNYENNNTDTFTFEIRLKKYDDSTTVPKQINFAICLQAANQEFWDNNLGWNYVLDVLERQQ